MTFYTLCLAVTLFYLASSCDETQYMKNGKCCKMCGPGKRMLLNDNCEDPSCQDCLDGEYQSEYTSNTKCDRQPNCDTNLNFLPQLNPSKTSRSECKCKAGYFCTDDDDCSVCRTHTVCRAGQKILKTGSSVSDTVCETCKNGTFSTSDGSPICQQWTVCEPGYEEKRPGSSTSDRICEKGTPSKRGAVLGGVIAALSLVVTAIVISILVKKGIIGWRREATQTRYEPNFDKETDAIMGGDKIFNQQPQENADYSISDGATANNVTENGNHVAQEDGKHSICPSTETWPSQQA